MKKYSLLLFLLFQSLLSYSQIQLGIKTGYFFYSATSQNDHNSAKYAASPDSYLASITANTRTKSVFNVGIELEYQTRSFDATFKDSWAGGSEYGNYHFQTDQVNFYIKPQFVIGKKVKLVIWPGLFFGYLVKTEVHGTRRYYSMGLPHDSVMSGSANSFFRPFDFGLVAGFTLEIPVQKALNVVCENSYCFNIATGSSSLFLNMKFEAGVAYTFRSSRK